MTKELLGLSPFVASELPYLTGRENGHDTRPVVRFELIWRIDQDKSVRLFTQRVQCPSNVQKISSSLRGECWMVGRDVEAGIKKSFDVRHSQ